MRKRSGFPDLREAAELSQKQIEQEIHRLKRRIELASGRGGAAKHKTERHLSSWEHILEQRFGVAAPHRPSRSGLT